MMTRAVRALVFFVLISCTTPSTQEHAMEGMQHMAMHMHAGAQDSLQVMNDVLIAFERPSAETGKEASLPFTLTKEGKPFSDLQIMHDKLMHVILVRKDLAHFDHIHPEQITPGTFVVPYTFSAAGEYRIWADFTFDNMQHLVDFDLNVTGEPEAEESNRLGELTVKMNQPEFVQGKPTKLTFTITDENGNPVQVTEKFLAADGHLIIIDETLDEFAHAHDETGDEDHLLSFAYEPKEPGKHKAWAQFRVDGKERVAEFEFLVNKV